MATPEAEQLPPLPSPSPEDEQPRPTTPLSAATPANGDAKPPVTPTRAIKKAAPAVTPRIKKKVPWRGKNIMVLLPRDDERGLPGKAPKPLRRDEINRMFSSWEELGYNVDGFDLLVENEQPAGTDDSQSRGAWPDHEDLARDRAQRDFKVALPDLNAWKDYVNELQEAKLRALGVSFAEEEPPAPPSPSPPTTNPSRQPSAQYPPLPFSPPIPTSSASSNHGLQSFPFTAQFTPTSAQSPAIASPVPFGGPQGKFNPRQSISFSGANSPFQLPQQSPPVWTNQPGGPQGINQFDPQALANFSGMMSPQSPFGLESGFQPGSPGFNLQGRPQSLQYPLLPHQQLQQQQSMRGSPRLHDVQEDEEDGNKSPSKTPEPTQQNADNLQAEIEDAEYHLEEQLRNELEHDDYHPHAQHEKPAGVSEHERQPSGTMPVPEHFANEPSKPLVLHHPRPHSRGHSLSQNFFRDSEEPQSADQENTAKPFDSLNDIPEGQKGDESFEIQTNPSGLGTPVHEFDFSASLAQHQQTASNASNPWNPSGATYGAERRKSSHESKPSLSKLNVKAPEFKFNPTSTFTPGQFSFGGSGFQPTVFQAGTSTTNDTASSVEDSIASLTDAPKPGFGIPEFVPGQSEFSFTSSGPLFRPDAPSFTPFQPAPPTVASRAISGGKGHAPRESIFGNIQIPTSEIVKPVKKSKAIPIVRPSSRTSAQSPQIIEDSEANDDDGRAVVDESRIKRARSQAPDGDDVPLFAEQPKEPAPVGETTAPISEILESANEDVPADNDNALAADTSMSSAVTSEQVDTKATTAAPSETSPVDPGVNRWAPFEFGSKFDASSFNEARPIGEDVFRENAHEKTLSATAQPFTPGASFSTNPPAADEVEVEPVQSDESAHEDSTPVPVPQKAKAPEPVAEAPKPKPASKGLGTSRFASPPPKPKGLAASRFAAEPAPEEPEPVPQPEPVAPVEEPIVESVENEPEPLIDVAPVSDKAPMLDFPRDSDILEPSFEDIDEVMQHLENDPSKGVNRSLEPTQPPVITTSKSGPLLDVESPTYKLEPPVPQYTEEERSPTPPTYHEQVENDQADTGVSPLMTTELEDPFLDPVNISPQSPHTADELEEPKSPISDWEAAFSADEPEKLESRAQFFDGRVNEMVGSLLASRLEPMEKTLFEIQNALAVQPGLVASSRREMRSKSAETRDSDADDEDEDPIPRRSMSPRRDRRMEQIRAAVMEGLAAQQRAQPPQAPVEELPKETPAEESSVLKALAEMKEQLYSQPKPEYNGNELKEIIEAAVQSRMPQAPEPDSGLITEMDDLKAKVADLELRLHQEQETVEQEMTKRRIAEDTASETNRNLQAAETRVMVETMNKSVFDQRVTDLEEKLREQERQTEEQVQVRRTAEDRLSEVQRLLRIASEEENRLREVNDEKDQRIRSIEQANGKTSMKMTLLEASQTNATQAQTEMTNKINILEADLRAVRQDNNYWRAEAERADETARRNAGELAHTVDENHHLQKSLGTLSLQLEENERLRETWRGKFLSLQDDMGNAAREIAEENAGRIKRDQAMRARQEVLDARLQAEAKTRERLEVELDRLQTNERDGMRAVNECKRLEGIIGEMRTENHKLQQYKLEAQRDLEDARETAANEIKRTRMVMQNEVDSAYHQVNMVRAELEDQNSKLRAELDSFKLDADTAKAKNEMLLEESETSKTSALEELKRKHQEEIEDLQAQHEQQRSVASEEAQRTEQSLLERLSFSASKIEHLQDRVLHLEEKVEIAQQAAVAAAAAAKSAGAKTGPTPTTSQPEPVARKVDLPEKISPQALRESIMVLQEQLQAREQRIEELEQNVSKMDPDAPSKISKRDDEISWLRELLAVRHGDLQDIITALSGDAYNRERVKDAAIRLKANLQMEEQERERALNGGSAIKLPNITQSIQAASPRVAQTIAPIAAAWGNWRRGNSN